MHTLNNKLMPITCEENCILFLIFPEFHILIQIGELDYNTLI
jgi:hypothetical protein